MTSERAGWSRYQMIVAVALLTTAAGNAAFFGKVMAVWPPGPQTAVPLLALAVAFAAVSTLLLTLFAIGPLLRPLLILWLQIAAFAAYFMDSFGVVINTEMLDNAVQTQVAEARDLFNVRLLAYWLVLGIVPGIVVWRLRLRRDGWLRALAARALLAGGCVAVIASCVLGQGGFFASFIREHKPLRSYANPAYPIYSAVRYAGSRWVDADEGPVATIAEDAKVRAADPHREFIVLVVGETARADRFSLNGYARPTNPELSREAVFSFRNVRSCGTSTAVSVPCMFSLLGQADFDVKSARRQENLLDIIQRAGAAVLWLDNNSDSKGVALRVPYENYRTPDRNPSCDGECRDVGMLGRVRAFADSQPTGDIVVVLHAMGNHGPAYYKRYPPAFEKFVPACHDNDLSRCSAEEISNAYDNAILYTDHFLAQVIALLKNYDDRFETAMVYFSDHGESLGEGGTWLHGLPLAIAPESQTHVPAVFWFGRGFDDVAPEKLRQARDAALNHDHLAHTIMGMLEIETRSYRRELDLLADYRPEDWQ